MVGHVPLNVVYKLTVHTIGPILGGVLTAGM